VITQARASTRCPCAQPTCSKPKPVRVRVCDVCAHTIACDRRYVHNLTDPLVRAIRQILRKRDIARGVLCVLSDEVRTCSVCVHALSTRAMLCLA
jgi:tRNA A37 threonylcarbamoyladenosine dehydratase